MYLNKTESSDIMKFRIVARLQKSKRTVGYQLQNLATEEKVNISKSETILLAYKGHIINAISNSSKSGLIGRNDTDLRSLPVKNIDNLNKNKKTNNRISTNQIVSNHEMAKAYLKKRSLLGLNDIVLNLLPDDEVELVKVTDTVSTGSFTVPSFITSFRVSISNLWNNVTDAPFCGCRFTEIIIDNNPNYDLDLSGLFSRMASDKLHIVIKHPEKITGVRKAFQLCSHVQSISGISNWCIQNTLSLDSLFNMCTSLEDISEVSNWDTSNIQSIELLFNGCKQLTDFSPLKNWDVSSCIKMDKAFRNCLKLKNLEFLKNWDTRSVCFMTKTFEGCINLIELHGLSNWNTQNLKNTVGLFVNCSRLSDINALSNWNTQSLSTYEHMFSGCDTLKDVSALKSWNTDSVKNSMSIQSILSWCDNLDIDTVPDIFKPYINSL